MTCEMAVMDQTGDTKYVWDPSRPAEVEAARATFDSLKAKGYLAFRSLPGGDRGEAMAAFDPNAGKVILVPPLVGG